MTGTSSHPISLRIKVGLVGFGALCALIISIVVLQFVPLSQRGTEFESIEELRHAMLQGGPSENTSSTVGEAPVSLRALVRPHPNDSIIYTLKPDLDLTFMRARVRTNSCGMRSPERPILKPPGVYRIALLGDSFAFGWGVEEHETFAQRLEDALNLRASGSLRFEVLNFGVPGYSTFQEVALFEELGLQFNPDAVLVYFVQNDFGMPFFIRDVSGSGGGILSSVKFVQMANRVLRPEQTDTQMQKRGIGPDQALRRLDEITSERGIKTFLTINPRKSWKSDLKRLPSTRNSISLRFLPLRDGLLEYMAARNVREEDLTLTFDPHPSPLRHNIFGHLLSAYFLEVIP
jgi:hypothetical protein